MTGVRTTSLERSGVSDKSVFDGCVTIKLFLFVAALEVH